MTEKASPSGVPDPTFVRSNPLSAARTTWPRQKPDPVASISPSRRDGEIASSISATRGGSPGRESPSSDASRSTIRGISSGAAAKAEAACRSDPRQRPSARRSDRGPIRAPATTISEKATRPLISGMIRSSAVTEASETSRAPASSVSDRRDNLIRGSGRSDRLAAWPGSSLSPCRANSRDIPAATLCGDTDQGTSPPARRTEPQRSAMGRKGLMMVSAADERLIDLGLSADLVQTVAPEAFEGWMARGSRLRCCGRPREGVPGTEPR